MVADDESDQSATGDAFDVLHYIAAKRLTARRLTVIDATNLRPEDRLDEVVSLLAQLGYSHDGTVWRHPEGRRAILLGDLVDRGPDSPGVLRLAMDMVAAGTARCLQGNHDNRLLRALQGRPVKVSHGLAETQQQFAAFRRTAARL